MNEAKVKEVQRNCLRVLDLAKQWERKCDKNVKEREEWANQHKDTHPDGSPWTYSRDANQSPKESGALKRASMDLTRSLSDLRKPG